MEKLPIKKLPSEVKDLSTKSAKIRFLCEAGWSTGDISRSLGIIYQHVRNVIKTRTKDWEPR